MTPAENRLCIYEVCDFPVAPIEGAPDAHWVCFAAAPAVAVTLPWIFVDLLATAPLKPQSSPRMALLIVASMSLKRR